MYVLLLFLSHKIKVMNDVLCHGSSGLKKTHTVSIDGKKSRLGVNQSRARVMTTTPGTWEEGTGGGEYDYADGGYGSFEETVANPGNEE